jgi:hypothetical protein
MGRLKRYSMLLKAFTAQEQGGTSLQTAPFRTCTILQADVSTIRRSRLHFNREVASRLMYKLTAAVREEQTFLDSAGPECPSVP